MQICVSPVARRISVNKAGAAQAQLESAILIWFTRDDPIALRTLSEAAHDCYHALCWHRKKPSILADFLASQSEAFQKRQRDTRNFLKHGRKRLTGKIPLDPIYAEVQLFECLYCHRHLFGKMTPLMRLYHTRLVLENPHILPSSERAALFEGLGRNEFGKVEIAALKRSDFLYQLLPFTPEAFTAERDWTFSLQRKPSD